MKIAEALRPTIPTPEHDSSPEPKGELLSSAEIMKLQAERQSTLALQIETFHKLDPDFKKDEHLATIAKMQAAELDRGALFSDVFHFTRFSDLHDPSHDKGIDAGLGSGFEQGDQLYVKQHHTGTTERGWVFMGINPENGLAKVARRETVTDADGSTRERRLWNYVSLNDLKRANGMATETTPAVESTPPSPEALAVARTVGDTALESTVASPFEEPDDTEPYDRVVDVDDEPAEPKAEPTLSEQLMAQTEASLSTVHKRTRRLRESRAWQRELDRAKIGQELQGARADLRAARKGRISAMSERLFGNETFNTIAENRKQAYKEITEVAFKDATEEVKKEHIKSAKTVAKNKLKAERAEKRRLARNNILDAKARRHTLRVERRNLRRSTKAGGRNSYFENRKLVKNGLEMPYINTEGMTEAQRAELERHLSAVGRGKRAPRRV